MLGRFLYVANFSTSLKRPSFYLKCSLETFHQKKSAFVNLRQWLRAQDKYAFAELIKVMLQNLARFSRGLLIKSTSCTCLRVDT
jgi:hypothetical protein